MNNENIFCKEKQLQLEDVVVTPEDAGDINDFVSERKIRLSNAPLDDILRKSSKENVEKIIDDFLKEFTEKVKTFCIQRSQMGFRKCDFALFRDFQVYCKDNNYSYTLYAEEEDAIISKLNEWAISEKIDMVVNIKPSEKDSVRIENTYDTTIKW